MRLERFQPQHLRLALVFERPAGLDLTLAKHSAVLRARSGVEQASPAYAFRSVRRCSLRSSTSSSPGRTRRMTYRIPVALEVDVIVLTVDRAAHRWKLRGCSDGGIEIALRR